MQQLFRDKEQQGRQAVLRGMHAILSPRHNPTPSKSLRNRHGFEYTGRIEVFWNMRKWVLMTGNGKRLYLVRPLEKTDIPTFTRWFCDLEDLSAFDRSARIPLGLEASEKTWSDALGNDGKNGKYWFAIDDTEANTIGIVGLESHSVINGDAVISLYIVRSERRQGVGVRTIALLSDVAFKQLGLNRITSYYHAGNEGSRKLTARLGFEVEGRMREAWFSGGQRADMVVVGLLRQDWFERRAALALELDTRAIVSFGAIASAAWSWPSKDADG